jgi:hypothetical protein
MLSPRFAIFLLELFTNKLDLAFNSFWLGFAGFLFLPWTTLVYALAYDPFDGVTGLGIFLVVFAFIVDVASWFGGGREGYKRQSASGYV